VTATNGSISGRKIWATGAGAKNNVINVYVKTDPAVDYRKGMSLFLVPNDTPGARNAQARHAWPPLRRDL
jgi:alkylation response protein AidB-like acyl-CoA dehydrogenase